MECVKRNRGVIIFYLLLAMVTLVVINFNGRNLNMDSGYVYLAR